MRICVIKARGRQFTANCCTGMADLATVVSQALGIKFYYCYCLSRPAFKLPSGVAQPVGLQLHRPDVVRIPNAGSLGSIKLLQLFFSSGALGVLNSFSFSSALEKKDLLDRLGSKLVIPANNSD